VKDLFEHQLGWKDDGSGKTLRLARYCTAGLGVSAILAATLAGRIFPEEFERGTLMPLLAKPVSRAQVTICVITMVAPGRTVASGSDGKVLDYLSSRQHHDGVENEYLPRYIMNVAIPTGIIPERRAPGMRMRDTGTVRPV